MTRYVAAAVMLAVYLGIATPGFADSLPVEDAILISTPRSLDMQVPTTAKFRNRKIDRLLSYVRNRSANLTRVGVSLIEFKPSQLRAEVVSLRAGISKSLSAPQANVELFVRW